MVGYLQRKYEGENISLVLALGAPALKFYWIMSQMFSHRFQKSTTSTISAKK
jgi:hypothetical protein